MKRAANFMLIVVLAWISFGLNAQTNEKVEEFFKQPEMSHFLISPDGMLHMK